MGTEVTVNKENELKVTSPLVSDLLYNNGFIKTDHMIQTFDYVEFEKEQFKIIGRSSQILKIAGKRYSTIQIENILEACDEIEKAVVFVKQEKDSLRGEVLDVTLEAKKELSVKEIKNILKAKLSNLKFSIELKYVEKISLSSVGKKLRV